MPQRQLTGSRIRERRIDLEMRQTDLAQAVGISASYLNLIEHNRRRIGGKLLNDLARALQVDLAALTEGAEVALLDQLRSAAAQDRGAGAELSRTEDFAGRFPGWSGLVTRQAKRITDLEARVKVLTDRLAHDPQLATSLHEVITAVTAIRSTASILVTDNDIDRDWEERFHRNIYEDSLKLAESSRALVSYLDTPSDEGAAALSPHEEVEAYLDAQGFHLPYLEEGGAAHHAPTLRSKAAASILAEYRATYSQDVRDMPLVVFSQAATELGHDPALLAARFGVSLAAAMRRLATLPETLGHPAFGLAMCDAAGAITLQRSIPGFSLPRSAASCPLWPLFSALSQPMQPIRRDVQLPIEGGGRFRCYAIATPAGAFSFDTAPTMQAVMLVRPITASGSPADPVGTSCRICSRSGCRSRREPSILNDDAV
ncbi:transcriptional regulator [Marivivens niveibacter]|uniref:Transcriptional regulator n=1 Tax=Marivivens niveibacter TaxID=1930667 RepID=A0A251X2N7_9RHOB|nr:helix-turn-helix transcriptional regulator [Marivivens niveibacter]OUD10584.1 transcriptional regulator [Marivivens niveibacter]